MNEYSLAKVEMDKKKVLFILHMPPPIHGASMMGKYIFESDLINQSFDCKYINLSIASSIDDIQKFGVKKLFRYVALLNRIFIQLILFRPKLVYLTPNACGKPFYKEFPIMVLLKIMGKRVVIHYHNKGVPAYSDKWLDNILYKIFFYHTKVILLSDRLYSDIAKYVRRENVHICPNGIPKTELFQFERNVDKHDTPILFFLSNLLVAKGVWTLVDALGVLSEQGVEFQCIFAGYESMEISGEQLRKKITEKKLSSKVSYYGPACGEDKMDLYKKADIFVFPSHNECFPLVLLEAMQCGLPCITTAEGGILDIIEDGVNGVVCKTDDSHSLSQAIESLIKDKEKRKKMGMKGRKRYENFFSLDKFYIRFADILSNY